MKKVKILQRVVTIALSASLAFSLFGCGSSTGENKKNDSTTQATTGQAPTTTEVKKEPVHLTILWREEAAATNINNFKDNPVYQKLQEVTNTTFEILGWNNDKLKISIAGGDLPDLVCVEDVNSKTLFDAKLIVDMKPLIDKTGSENLLYCPARIKYQQDYLKTDGIYFLTPTASGPEVTPGFNLKQDVGPTIRWDYYKELGMPSIQSLDDLLDVLEEMVKRHPTTPEGKKVYAFSNLNDWSGGLWSYGMLDNVSGVACYNELVDVAREDQKIINEFYGKRNPYYQGARIMNKAFRKGLVHPDAFTMKMVDFEAAALKGEILYNSAVYGFEKANVELMKGDNPTSFITIPFDFGYSYSDVAPRNNLPSYLGVRGMSGKNWSVTKNCKNPEGTVEFLNYCFSAEGSRLLYNGLEGVHWEYVNNKPVLKQETIDMLLAGGDPLNKSGAFGGQGSLGFLAGKNKSVVHPDGELVNLQNVTSTYKKMMNPVQADYAASYGVEYPYEAFVKKYKEGKQKFNPDYKAINMPGLPEDMKRIYTKITDVLVKGLPKTIIVPKTDEEFEAAFNKLKEELNDAGAQELYKWTAERFEEERTKAYGQ